MSPTRIITVNNIPFVRCRQCELIIGKKYMMVILINSIKRDVMYGPISYNDEISIWTNITYVSISDIHKTNDIIKVDSNISSANFFKIKLSKKKFNNQWN